MARSFGRSERSLAGQDLFDPTFPVVFQNYDSISVMEIAALLT
jgi:hypothetical protein